MLISEPEVPKHIIETKIRGKNSFHLEKHYLGEKVSHSHKLPKQITETKIRGKNSKH